MSDKPFHHNSNLVRAIPIRPLGGWSVTVACVLLAILLAACDGQPTTPPRSGAGVATRIVTADGDQQTALTAMRLPVRPTVYALDNSGRGVPGIPVRFMVTMGGGWVSETTEVLTDASGRASTEWYMGPRAGGGHIMVATTPIGSTGFRAYVNELEREVVYRSGTGLIEVMRGELPLIMGAPHGGSLRPADIADRDAASMPAHPTTQDLVRGIVDNLRARGGRAPFYVASLIDRRKMDPDLPQPAGTGGDASAEIVWREYHALLAALRTYVQLEFERGLLVDVQGDAPVAGRVDLGYLLSAEQLAQSNTVLDQGPSARASSIRALLQDNHPAFSQLVRGSGSLGDLLGQLGVRALPSPTEPAADDTPYIGTSYSAAQYGSRDGGLVSALVMRVPASLRDAPQDRTAFAANFADALNEYFTRYYRIALIRQ